MRDDMRQSDFDKLREASWRTNRAGRTPGLPKELSPQESEELNAEATLSRLIKNLPDEPVATNFTSVVMQSVRTHAKTSQPVSFLDTIREMFFRFPRFATSLLVVGVLGFSGYGYRSMQKREFARNVATASTLADVPKMEWLKDFEAINRLNAVTTDDHDLLLAIKGN